MSSDVSWHFLDSNRIKKKNVWSNKGNEKNEVPLIWNCERRKVGVLILINIKISEKKKEEEEMFGPSIESMDPTIREKIEEKNSYFEKNV